MTKKITTDIAKAVATLRSGGLVAFPTETVYGLGADAMNEAAIRNIFKAKERPYDHPLIVHIAHLEQLLDWAHPIPPSAIKLAHAFWPGPLTMILKKRPQVLDIVTGAQDTVGVRMPRHPIALELLTAFNGGVVAPSANKFTHISPTTAAAVGQELGAVVDMILDGGACEVGLESTIIDMSGEHPVILRPGMLSAQALEAVLEVPVSQRRQDAPVTRAPGMHHLHYAPTTPTELIEVERIQYFVDELKSKEFPVALVLRVGPAIESHPGVHRIRLPVDPVAYAHDLYHTLRTLDNQHFKRIVIEQVPASVEWDAIRDRLSKASAAK